MVDASTCEICLFYVIYFVANIAFSQYKFKNSVLFFCNLCEMINCYKEPNNWLCPSARKNDRQLLSVHFLSLSFDMNGQFF